MAKLVDIDDLPQNFKKTHYEPKQNTRFLCEIVEVDDEGNEVRGIPNYVVQGISGFESEKNQSVVNKSHDWCTHRFVVNCYLPVVPMVEEIAYAMFTSGNKCRITIRDLGPVGDIVSEKVYMASIERITKSDMFYEDKDESQILSLHFVSKDLKYTFDYVG